jgi:hypothetical protein
VDFYFVGVDLGQSRDYTAIAVVERTELRGDWDGAKWAWRKVVLLRLRFLERIALGTPYPEVVRRVLEVTHSRGLAGRCHLAVDGTGVGPPVVDMLRAAGPGCPLSPVVVTSGEKENRADGYYRVPKRNLIVGLQVLLQRHALRIAAGMTHGEALVAEMAEMQVKVTGAGREQFGAWRQGTHDDLVFAVALACWAAKRAYPREPAGEIAWWTSVEYQTNPVPFPDTRIVPW